MRWWLQSAAEAALLEWLCRHGFQDAGALERRQLEQAGRAMFFARDVAPFEHLLAVPIELTLYSHSPHLAERTVQVLRAYRWVGCAVSVCDRLCVMHECMYACLCICMYACVCMRAYSHVLLC